MLVFRKFKRGGVKGFLVSNKYENPNELHRKTVYRIEDLKTENLGTVIVAAGWQFIEEIIKDLSQYNISSLNIISPLLFDSWPMDMIKTNGCKISPNAAIAEDAQIFADDTSEITIESGVIIHSKIRILASQGSRITIKSNTQLKEEVFISAEDGMITIGAFSYLSEKSSLIANQKSAISMGTNTVMGEKSSLFAQKGSSIRIGNKIHLAEKANIRAEQDSAIRANRNLSLGDGASIHGNKKGLIQIDHHVFLDKDSNISAYQKGNVKISYQFSLGKLSHVGASNMALIKIGHHSGIGKSAAIGANNSGKLCLGNKSGIGDNTACNSVNQAMVDLGSEIMLSNNGTLDVDNGILTIGNSTSINAYFYIGCTQSKISIGEDNMFSYFVKMNAGSHEIIDKNMGRIVDNTMPIITGNHVWLGAGTMIGASSLVNKTMPAHSVCAGTPAKVIRSNIKWNREKSDKQ